MAATTTLHESSIASNTSRPLASHDETPHHALSVPVQPTASDTPPLDTPPAPNDNKTPPDPPSAGSWTRFGTKIVSMGGQKIELTISKLTFIITIIALMVAVLSYSYGAASFRVAEKAFMLQQLEFCKDHGDDPVGSRKL